MLAERLETRDLLTTIDLAVLTADQGAVIYGAGTSDSSGTSVSIAGDVNGDGFDDLLIGAPLGDAANNSKSDAGESYLVFGGPVLPATIDLAALGTAGVTIYGVDAADESGRTVSAAGDVNGDGFDDLFIAASLADAGGNAKTDAGESYLIFGRATFPAAIDLAAGGADVSIFGADPGDGDIQFFTVPLSVASAGDVNGDGFDELLIGAGLADAAGNAKGNAGESYLIYGGPSLPATIDLASVGNAGVIIYGAESGDHSGFSVSGAGDVNADGFADLLIGAAEADGAGNGNSDAGESYLVYGGVSLPGTIDLASLGAAGVTIYGIDSTDLSGYSVSGAGDVNSDGFDDLLIGARYGDGADNNKPFAGEYYLIFGGASLPVEITLATLGSDGVTIFAADQSDQTSRVLGNLQLVSGAGDVNGDGFDDLLIGAHGADSLNNARSTAGESYVIFGAETVPSTIDLFVTDAAGITIYGADGTTVPYGDLSGNAVSGGGDIDGDGFDDLLVGALGADASGGLGKTNGGETYVLFGGDVTTSVTHAGTAAAETLTGDTGANVMIGGRGDDMLVGGGGADVLRGGEGDDVLAIGDLSFRRIVGGNGNDTLRLDIDSANLDLAAVPDNRITGVEQIDLSGGGNDTLTLNVLEVLNLSDESNTLVVRRDAADVVNVGAGWTLSYGEQIGNDLFEVFTQGAAVLKLQTFNTFLVNLSVDATDLSESGASQVTVTATTNFVVSGNLTLDVAVSGVGITTGDYRLSDTQITIPDGQTSGNVTFSVQDDSLVESLHETATLAIIGLAGGLIAGAPAAVTIEDNDFLTPMLATTTPDPTNLAAIPVTVDFGNTVSEFDVGDVLVSGGMIDNFVDLAGGRFSFEVAPASDGVISVDIGAGAAIDVGGKDTLAANSLARSSDRTAPPTVVSGGADPINADPFDVSIDFGETMTGFIASDIAVTNGSVINLVDLGGGQYAATIDAAVDGSVAVGIAGEVATDLAGNGNLPAPQYSVVVDTKAPAPTITGPTGPINSDTFDVSIDFGEMVTGFVAADITVGNGAVTNVVDQGDGRFGATIDPSADGVVTVDVVGNVAADLAGNANAAASQFSIVLDTIGPTPTMTGLAGPKSPDRFDLTIDFGESVVGFVAGDLMLTNGAVVALVDDGGGRFTASIDADADGPLTVDIAAGIANDAAGNPNLAAAAPFSTMVDTRGPLTTITGPDGPLSDSQFSVLISFNAPVTGLFASEITVDNGLAVDLVNSGGGNFVAQIAADEDGPVTVSLAADVANDGDGNGNQASALFTVVIDRTRPIPTITVPLSPTHSDPFAATIDFGELVSDFVADDVIVLGGLLTSLVDGGDGVFLATIKAATDGTVTVDLDAGVATDLAGNPNRDADPVAVTVDTTAPLPVISGPSGQTNADPFSVTIDFGQPVVGFATEEIVVAGGVVADLADHGDGSFTATIDAMSEGSVTVDIPASVASDLAGNDNVAADPYSVVVDTTAPAPVISGPTSPTNQDPLEVLIDFGETVIGFASTDVTVGGGLITNLVDNGNGRFTATVNGQVTVGVAMGVAVDNAGNPSREAETLIITVAANLDFGDAPTAAQSGFASDYPVTLADDGARHLSGPLTLGGLIDTEVSGVPTADAAGDGADEDGVFMVTSLVAASTAATSSISIVSSGEGKLDAWIDFNADGDWIDPGEQIWASLSVTAGENVLPLTIPADAKVGLTAVRFRLSTLGGLQPTGAADDGEVEDYLVTILDGNALPEVTVESVGTEISLSSDRGNYGVFAASIDRFRAPTESVGSLRVVGTSGDDSLRLNLGGGFPIPVNGLRLLGGAGNNTLVIDGDGGAIDFGDAQISVHDFAQLDLSAADETTLVLDSDSVARLAPNTAVVRVIAAAGDLLEVRRPLEWRMTDPITVGTEFFVTATHQQGDPAVIEADLRHPWQNFLRPSDVNNDGAVTALDALVVINELARNLYVDATTRELLDPRELTTWPGNYFDQNGDGRATALDALRVINRLGVVTASAAEGEQGEFVPVTYPRAASSSRLALQTTPAVPGELNHSSPRDHRTSMGKDQASVAASEVQNTPARGNEVDAAIDAVDQLLTDDTFLRSLIGANRFNA